jgi:hypothetical protein
MKLLRLSLYHICRVITIILTLLFMALLIGAF